MQLLQHYSLRSFNTLKVEAKADFFCTITQVSDIAELAQQPAYLNSEKLVLGGGSNILLLGDYPGYVLHNTISGVTLESETDQYVDLRVGGGENWHALVQYCVAQGWGGIENLALIPGTAGAAPVQNIGAYGVELKDVLVSLCCVELNSGELKTLTNAECEFGYRDSVFKRQLKNQFLISSILIRLQKKPQLKLGYGEITQQLQLKNISQPDLQDVFDTICEIRAKKLPDPAVLPNAGSFFKNPLITATQFSVLTQQFDAIPHYPAPNQQIKLAAGWLIEQAGWKGKGLGAVRMYEKQALVLVNEGGSGADVIRLAQQVQQAVREKFQVELEIEPDVLPLK